VVLSNIFDAGLGEELGWRGFALPRMQARKPALAASLLLGILWGLWHLPFEIAVGISPLGYLDFLLFIIGFSVLYTWVYNNTWGSLFLIVLFHAVMDIVVSTILPTSTTWIVPILTLILLWVVVALVVVMAGAARLSRSSTLAPA
jgi:membrane protease YdiL (CAAX protease family)